MKIPTAPIFSILVLSAHMHAAEEAPEPVFRDVATHESLSQKLREMDAKDPMKELEKSEGADSSKENQPLNLIESSDLISYQGVTTLVPKRAIMQIPDKYKDRVNNHVPGNRVVGWLDFYSLNRGWITTVEISRSQAGGNEGFSEALAERLSKNKNMVVTVLDSGPISYLPYRGEENEEGKTE